MTDSKASAAVRRTLDVVVSAVGLVVLAPPMGIIAVLVRRESRGPAIFRQQRIGRHGKPFIIYKFRTMRTGGNGPSVTSSTDVRVTPLGARLRSSKIDELPQLFNVLKGDMSLVGPRPELPCFVDQWDPDLRELVLSIRPGITDPMTLSLRREESLLASSSEPEDYYRLVLLPQKVKAYAGYAQTRTLTGDLMVIVRTLREVVFG